MLRSWFYLTLKIVSNIMPILQIRKLNTRKDKYQAKALK